MPMAGLGSRFFKEGYLLPKPLIEVDGMPMFTKTISSFENWKIPMKLSFVVRREHVEKFKIDKTIKSHFKKAHIVIIDAVTRGSVETSLAAKKFIDKDDGVLLMDCDLYFESDKLEESISNILDEKSDIKGMLVSFFSNDARYSYARADENGFVVEIAEKKVISVNALAGAYFFSTGELFLNLAKRLLDQKNIESAEYYTSLLYNYLLEDKGKIKVVRINKYASFGTPEELKVYNKTTNEH
jgi:dTDP-glucose pyrophosphorylase